MKKKMIFRDFSDFSIAGNNWKKKINYNEKTKKKNWCRNLEISYCMICIVRLYCGEQWQRQGAGLGIRRAQGRWGTGARAGALGRAAGAGACGRELGARAWHGQACCRRADARASNRHAGRAGERQAHGRAAAGRRRRRAAGRWARGRALGARGARGLGAWARSLGAWARAAWSPRLALGSALGALSPFSIRFDSFFFS